MPAELLRWEVVIRHVISTARQSCARPSRTHSTRHTTTGSGRGRRDLQGLAAGIDALGGNRSVALAQFREALTGYRVLGLAFDEALTVLDMVSLLGADEPEVLTAAEWARGTLTHLGAKPLVDRLDTAMSQPSRAPAGAAMEIGSGARSTSVTATTG